MTSNFSNLFTLDFLNKITYNGCLLLSLLLVSDLNFSDEKKIILFFIDFCLCVIYSLINH